MKGHKKTFVIALTQIVNEGSALARSIILARLIGIEQMGLAMSIGLLIRLLEMVSDMGLDRLLISIGSDLLPSTRKTIHAFQVFKGLALACVIVPGSHFIVCYFDSRIAVESLILAGIAVSLRGLVNLNYRERQRDQKFSPAFQVESMSNLGSALLAAPLALMTQDYTALVLASLIQSALMILISHAIAAEPMGIGLSPSALKRVLRYGLPIMADSVLMYIALQGDRVIVSIHFSASELASYAIAAQIALLPALMGSRFISIAYLPVFSAIENRSSMQPLILAILSKLVLASFSGGLILALFGGKAISLIYGPGYVPDQELMALLAAASATRLVRSLPSTYLLSMERTGILFLANLPRLFALIAAVAWIQAGAGLETLAKFTLASESVSLVYVLIVSSALAKGSFTTHQEIRAS